MPLTISSTSKNADYRGYQAIQTFLNNGLFRVMVEYEDHVDLIIPEEQWVASDTTDTAQIGDTTITIDTFTLLGPTP